MNRSKKKGRVKQAQGRLVAATGRVVGDHVIEGEGRLEQAVGKTRTIDSDLERDTALRARREET